MEGKVGCRGMHASCREHDNKWRPFNCGITDVFTGYLVAAFSRPRKILQHVDRMRELADGAA
jgi:hypothetical protein